MLSYTEMAVTKRPAFLAGPAALPADLEAWLLSLPPALQEKVKGQTAKLVRELPEAVQIQLAQQFAAKGEMSPVPLLALNGLGCPCMMKGLDGVGLGQWDTLFSGLMNTGAQLYSQHEAGNIQTSIASSTNAANAQIAQIQANAATNMQAILANAQLEAAQTAAAAKSGTTKYLIIFGGIAALLLAGGGAVYIAKRKKA